VSAVVRASGWASLLLCILLCEPGLCVQSLCSAHGHHIGPVDAFQLLHARLEAAYQRLDLSRAEAILDVNPGDNAPSQGIVPLRRRSRITS